MHRRGFLVGATGLSLAGCVAPTALPPETLAGVRRVALVTAFDPKLELTYTGITVFENQQEDVVVDWALDAHAMAAARRLLAPHYALVDLDIDRAAVIETQRPFGFRNRVGGLEKLMRERVPAGTADAVVVIATTPVRANEYPIPGARAGQEIYPYGLLLTGRLGRGFSRLPSAFLVAYGVSVLDGRSFKTLASHAPVQTTASPRRNLFGDVVEAETPPMQVLDFSWRGEGWDAIPTQHREAMRAAAPRLIDESLPGALRHLKLLPTGAS
jgi:hypothetical protein